MDRFKWSNWPEWLQVLVFSLVSLSLLFFIIYGCAYWMGCVKAHHIRELTGYDVTPWQAQDIQLQANVLPVLPHRVK